LVGLDDDYARVALLPVVPRAGHRHAAEELSADAEATTGTVAGKATRLDKRIRNKPMVKVHLYELGGAAIIGWCLLIHAVLLTWRRLAQRYRETCSKLDHEDFVEARAMQAADRMQARADARRTALELVARNWNR
jgi:hypothetical protein